MVPLEPCFNINLIDQINSLIKGIEENFKIPHLIDKDDHNFVKFENFKKWLDENGAIYKENFTYPIAYGKFKIIGAEAKREILPNEGILYLPKKLIIDSNELRNNRQFIELFEKIPYLKNLNILILTIYLLLESSREISFFKPYIDMINSDAPIFWGESLLSQIEEENFISDIIENKNDLMNYYSNLVSNKIINSEQINFNMFMTFYSFVLSRNFCVNDNQMLLVPLADALNHHHVSIKYECFDSENLVCKYTQEFDDTVCITKTDNKFILEKLTNDQNEKKNYDLEFNCSDTENIESSRNIDEIIIMKSNDFFLISTNEDQTFKIGHQVFNFYGHYSNEYLLKWYGFCYFNNIHDYISMILNIPKYEDAQFDKLLKLFFSKYLHETIKDNISFNTLFFKLKVKKVNLNLLNYIRFFYFYEVDEIDQFIDYKFEYETELVILNRTIELLKLSLEKKNLLNSLEEDYILLKEIFCNRKSSDSCKNEMRFFYILIFRITQKLNLIKQIGYFENIKNILAGYVRYTIQENSNDQNFLNNNQRIKFYLEKIYISIEIKNYFNFILNS